MQALITAVVAVVVAVDAAEAVDVVGGIRADVTFVAPAFGSIAERNLTR